MASIPKCSLVVLVYRLSGSGLAVSLTVILEIIPVLFLAPIAGVIIDRYPRKTILIVTDVVRAVLVFLLIFANQTWEIYAIVAFMTAASVFFNPTIQAIIPNVVEPDALLAANSVSWTTAQLVQIIASALAGGLIATIGTAPAFGFNALSFLFSAFLILRLALPKQVREIQEERKEGFASWFDDIRAGLQYARQDHFISRLIVYRRLLHFRLGQQVHSLLSYLKSIYISLRKDLHGYLWRLGLVRYLARFSLVAL